MENNHQNKFDAGEALRQIELFKSLDGIISNAVHRPGDNSYLWLAEGLCAKRADGTEIPISGTVSRGL